MIPGRIAALGWAPVRQEQVQGILMAALGVLVSHQEPAKASGAPRTTR
jgi:hypothetical protein